MKLRENYQKFKRSLCFVTCQVRALLRIPKSLSVESCPSDSVSV